MFSLAKAVKFWVVVSIGVIMFLGGGSLEWFFIKSFCLVAFLAVAKTVFGRLRIDQSFRLLWLVIGPLALIDLVRALTGFMVF